MRMEVDERFVKNFVNCWKTNNWVDFYQDKFSGRKVNQYIQHGMYEDLPDFITDSFFCDCIELDSKGSAKSKMQKGMNLSITGSSVASKKSVGSKKRHKQLWVNFLAQKLGSLA